MAEYLGPLGFAVSAVHDGLTGLERALAADENWQAVILDVMLPGMDGFEVLRRIRRRSDVPVLMLTARGDSTDRIVGLEIGADDYIPKTSPTRELLARLRAVLRRAPGTDASRTKSPRKEDVFEIDGLVINFAARSVSLDGVALNLTPVEYALLACLARARGRVKTREELYEEIRSRDYDAFDRSIDVHVSTLRRKLNDDPKQPRFIRTMRTAGYMFVG